MKENKKTNKIGDYFYNQDTNKFYIITNIYDNGDFNYEPIEKQAVVKIGDVAVVDTGEILVCHPSVEEKIVQLQAEGRITGIYPVTKIVN